MHMLRNLMFVSAVLLSGLSLTAAAGDCAKTLMGGGCGMEQEGGLAPHMRSQAQTASPEEKLKAAAKDTKTQKNIKVSDKPAQKPKI